MGGEGSYKRSGAEGNARSSGAAEISTGWKRQSKDERCGMYRRDRGACRRITRLWMALFTPAPACTAMEVLIHAGGKEVLQGAGKEPEMASMRNVAGEVLGAWQPSKRRLNSA